MSRGAADALYEQPGDVKELLDTHQLRPVLYFGEKSPSGLKNLPASQELGYGPGVVQFRAIIVKSGTDPATVKRYEEALEKIAAMPDFQAFLANRYVVGDNFMQNSDAHGFIEAELRGMSKIVRGLPLHSRYILDVKSSNHYYVEGF